jgi:CBS domain-containing protein
MPSQRPHLAAPPEAVDDDPAISAVMTPRIVAITPDCPLQTGLGLMAANDVRHLPVVEGSRCLGVVLETDIVRAVAIGGPPLLGALVRSVPMVPVGGRRSMAARAVLAGDVDAAVVTDGDRLVGIVTSTDLVRSLATGPRRDG